MAGPGGPAPPPAIMARMVDERDWTRTPLGPPGHWPLALRLALDLMLASRFPMCVMWGDERILLYNDGYAPILGARHPAALGQPAEQVWPEIWGQIAPLVERTYAGEALWFEDLPMQVTRHGHPEQAWFTFSYSPLRDALGVVRGVLNTVVETTARVTAEAALREAEARNRALLESIGDGFFALDREFRFTHLNPQATRILGQAPGEVLGRSVFDAYPGLEGHAFAALYRRVMETGEAGSARDFYPDHGRWYELRAFPAAEGITVFFRDVSEEQRSAAALAEREERLRLMADALPQIVWFAGPDGQVSWFNRRWHEFAGVPRGDGPPDHDARAAMIHPEDLPLAGERWAHAIATGEPYETEYRFREAATGAWRWHLGRALPARDARGAILAWYGTATDIHDQREAREVLARAQDELERLVEARTAELLRAEQALIHAEKLRALGQLTGSLAHDFGNVLQVVDSGIHLLADEGLSAGEREEVAQGVGASLENARRLIRQLLAFARQQPLEPVSFDLNARLGAMRELLRHSLGSRIALDTDFAEGLPPVTLDPAQLETAVLNLVMNARDAMPQGGRLSLRTALEGGRPALTVADTGEGMDAATQARLFEPFFTTKPAGKGTGLGLAQVHGFVAQSGGEIRVDSAPGRGTAFTLRF